MLLLFSLLSGGAAAATVPQEQTHSLRLACSRACMYVEAADRPPNSLNYALLFHRPQRDAGDHGLCEYKANPPHCCCYWPQAGQADWATARPAALVVPACKPIRKTEP
ncbi:hypothetical protein COO60DRAFT_388928 [Scenedesmus sp. NREL 46B-D3]|nr:hypothetical protein COO60DRAFT_388928 [Scenedesmus sp. NREL 46B-D3]